MDSFNTALAQAAAPMARAERAAHKMRDYVNELSDKQKKSFLERELMDDFWRTLKSPSAEGIPFVSNTLPRQDLMLESIDMWVGAGKGLVNRLDTKDVLNTIGGSAPATIRVDLVPRTYGAAA